VIEKSRRSAELAARINTNRDRQPEGKGNFDEMPGGGVNISRRLTKYGGFAERKRPKAL